MAYNYKDFLKAATRDGKLAEYDQQELDKIQQDPVYGLSSLALKKDMDAAQTPQQRMLAQATMDNLQKGYQPNQMISVGKPFHWGGEEQFNGLVDKVINRPAFNWDPTNDPNFSAFRKQMIREGDRAQANTLAQTSAMTGGTPSSWAVTAAGQAGNYHASKIADAIPSFQQRALDEYMKNRQMDINALDVLTKERQQAMAMWQRNYDNALRAYQMGEWTPEIAEILGLTWTPRVDASAVGGGGAGGPGGPGGLPDAKSANDLMKELLDKWNAERKETGKPKSPSMGYNPSWARPSYSRN